MARQQTPSQSAKSIAVPVLIGLELGSLNEAACHLSHFFSAIATEALGILPSVVLAIWQPSQAFASDPQRLLECLFQMLLSFWPAILTMAGAA